MLRRACNLKRVHARANALNARWHDMVCLLLRFHLPLIKARMHALAMPVPNAFYVRYCIASGTGRTLAEQTLQRS